MSDCNDGDDQGATGFFMIRATGVRSVDLAAYYYASSPGSTCSVFDDV
jgi:hypothetical protein